MSYWLNLVIVFAECYILWTLFLAYCALFAKWKELPTITKWLAVPMILVGVLVDIAFNWSFGLLLGITHDATFSQKLSRLKRGNDWRVPIAYWICSNLLDPFQVGGHCR